ncbi:MAG: hypothetical protein QOF42_3700 [Gammaproteobacteria bacterium]|jgi:hypothetical protein|nr:hypothetical protein [Gammaproteobacteria bacterium]
MQHLGFGCGRLAGGWDSANSRRLLEAALHNGIRYFDTAPYYGGGDSERLLGSVLQGSGQPVQICTKVGLYPRPMTGRARARSFAVASLRAALPDFALRRLKRRARQRDNNGAPRSFGSFDPPAMRASLERSLEALRCQQVDCLMLHEPAPSDPQAPAAEALEGFVKEGKVQRLGVGTYAALEDLPPFGAVAQFAIGRGTLIDPAGRSLIIHGLLRNADFAKFSIAVKQAGIDALLPSLSKRCADPLFLSGLLLNATILGTAVERVIVSSSAPKRLTAFLRVSEAIHSELRGAESVDLGSRLRSAVAAYLGVNIPPSEMLSS